MKKFKILALVMTCAILLSSFAMISVSAEEPSSYFAATNVRGRNMKIDGIKSADEGWSEASTLTMSYYHASDVTKSDGTSGQTGAKVWLAYDNDYMYVYYETTNALTLNSSNPVIYFQMATPSGSYGATNTANGETLHLRLNLAAGTSEKWDGATDSIGAQASNSLVFRMAHTKSGTVSYAKNDGFYDKVKVAFNEDERTAQSNAKISVEFRLPLAESYKTALLSDDGAKIKFSVWEKINYSGGQGNGGYILGESLYDWDGANGVGINLPKLAKTAPVLVGFQSKVNKDANENVTSYDVRFVAVVDDYDGFTFANSKLGFVFNNGTKDSAEQYCTKVYETLSYTKADGSTGTLNASDFGGNYFFCFTITGMNPTATYNLGVKCFTQVTENAPAEYCTNPVTVKITCTEGKVDFTY